MLLVPPGNFVPAQCLYQNAKWRKSSFLPRLVEAGTTVPVLRHSELLLMPQSTRDFKVMLAAEKSSGICPIE